MTEREKLLKQLSALQFASWELHLYMDTHPYDKDAMEMNRRYACRSEDLKALFESKYGPLSSVSGTGEQWLKNPWPWDIKECV